MPSWTHHLRLQRMERALGICECRNPRILICLKAIEAHERGEVEAAEPCPAGCPPEARPVVVLRVSSWRNDDECTCPGCDPHKLRRPAVPEPVAEPAKALPAAEPAGATAAPAPASEPHPDAARAPAPAADVVLGLGEAVQEPPAREQVVEVQRARVSVPLGAPPPPFGPEDVVEGLDPHGPCGFCRHPLQSHRCWTERLPCRYCDWPVTAHEGFDPARAFGLAFASRRAMACGTYLAIRFDGGEHDACTVDACGCPGWRLRAPYVSKHEEAMRAVRAEKARVIAGKAALLARLKAEHEERQLELLRAEHRSRREQEHNTPSGAPVYVEKG